MADGNKQVACPGFNSYERPLTLDRDTCKNMSSYGFELPLLYNKFVFKDYNIKFRIGKVERKCVFLFNLTINDCQVSIGYDEKTGRVYAKEGYTLMLSSELNLLQVHYSTDINPDKYELIGHCNHASSWKFIRYLSVKLESNAPEEESDCVFISADPELALKYDATGTSDELDPEEPIDSFRSWADDFECKEYCLIIASGQFVVLLLCLILCLVAACMVSRLTRDNDKGGWIERAEEKKRLHRKAQKEKEKKKEQEEKDEKDKEPNSDDDYKEPEAPPASSNPDAPQKSQDETVLDSKILNTQSKAP
ncbi:unnamed protein product [Bursaphelenchus okinawaensis]|uniref:Uncharacterized protein n=1 Tax=Bursaphelenchus okinawaensis TaxID=465554 RepID=A0A811JS07_9BILA|nr:unnamed protein product [Bursaphelenchus okinawaensis]CAG9079927.1 unnamed protein product [Bursaphelenchus okinawaensis]